MITQAVLDEALEDAMLHTALKRSLEENVGGKKKGTGLKGVVIKEGEPEKKKPSEPVMEKLKGKAVVEETNDCSTGSEPIRVKPPPNYPSQGPSRKRKPEVVPEKSKAPPPKKAKPSTVQSEETVKESSGSAEDRIKELERRCDKYQREQANLNKKVIWLSNRVKSQDKLIQSMSKTLLEVLEELKKLKKKKKKKKKVDEEVDLGDSDSNGDDGDNDVGNGEGKTGGSG